ncbi:MAG: hypothetical protein KW804_01735 [Candidatus Doudnabacteria bacterium]|nr:hypothetical protein [Candidatus Doudnabacteria bacterium]
MNSEIIEYIKNARQQGISDTQIKLSLTNAGWPETEVDEALKPVTIPHPTIGTLQAPIHISTDHHQQGMWIVFQYVLMFITLAFSAVALAGIAHSFVDDVFHGNLNASRSYWGEINAYFLTGYIATIIVAFPIFAYLFISLRKRISLDPTIRNIKVRKIFIYIALVWTFLVLIIRLVSVVYTFLFGTAAAGNSFAHFLVTFLIAGSIFLYFVLDVKKGSRDV